MRRSRLVALVLGLAVTLGLSSSKGCRVDCGGAPANPGGSSAGSDYEPENRPEATPASVGSILGSAHEPDAGAHETAPAPPDGHYDQHDGDDVGGALGYDARFSPLAADNPEVWQNLLEMPGDKQAELARSYAGPELVILLEPAGADGEVAVSPPPADGELLIWISLEDGVVCEGHPCTLDGDFGGDLRLMAISGDGEERRLVWASQTLARPAWN